MKLSKKGQIKIGESLCIFGRSLAGSRATALAQLAFEPDDFEDGCLQNGKDHIILPIEEARIIEHCLAFFKQHHKLYNSELKVWNLLQMRIEQAEKKNEV